MMTMFLNVEKRDMVTLLLRRRVVIHYTKHCVFNAQIL